VGTAIRRGHALTDNAGDTIRGIGLAAAAYATLAIGDASAKWVMLSTGLAWVLIGRGLFGAASVALVTLPRQDAGGWHRLLPTRWFYLLLRAVLSSYTTATWYFSWRYMQLADTYALGFTAPLIMTLLAIPMLGERIRWRRMLSTMLGFCGVLVMLRPGGNLWNPALPLLMSGIVAMAITRIMARQLARTETPECQAFWLMASHGICGVAMLVLTPSTAFGGTVQWLGLAFLGVSSGLAHCVFTLAYGLAPIAALAPYEYTMLIWGGAAGFLIFGEIPSISTLVGAAIVTAAGLYNLHRERIRRTQEP
jgi:drug/metabolite transporter (DMT)-like permease